MVSGRKEELIYVADSELVGRERERIGCRGDNTGVGIEWLEGMGEEG